MLGQRAPTSLTRSGTTNTSNNTSSNNATDSVEGLHLMREFLKARRQLIEDNRRKRKFTWRELIETPFHPDNVRRTAWDIVLLFVIIYCALLVPVDLGVMELDGPRWDFADTCIMVFFCIDIIVNSHTAYYDDYGNLEQRHSKIVGSYLFGWAPLDIMSTVPFDKLLAHGPYKGAAMMRLPRIVKMVRLARLMRLARVQQILQRIFGIHLLTNMAVLFTVRFFSLFVLLLLVTHWLACAFCAVAAWPETEGFQSVFPEDGKTPMGWTFRGVRAIDLSTFQRYQLAYYFAFCTLIMVKPAEIEFLTSHCRYFFMLIGFIKPVVAAAIMGVLTNMIVKQNTKRGNLQIKMQKLGVFMQTKKVPISTQHQVLAYMEHAERQMETLQDIDALSALSPTLQEEVAYTTMRNSVGFFVAFEYGFGVSFVRQLCSMLKLELFGPDDVVCHQGHIVSQMGFINSGRLKLFRTKHLASQILLEDEEAETEMDEIEHGNDKLRIIELRELTKGMTCGAEALLQPGIYRSEATSLCFVFCEVSFLKKHDFLSVIARNPEWDSTLKKFHMAFRSSADTSSLVETLAEGNVEVLESILSEQGQQSASVYTKMFQRVTHHLIRMRRMLKTDNKNFVVKSPRDSSEAFRGTHTSGFHTMQMNNHERRMMTEIQNLPTVIQSSMSHIEERLDDVVSTRLNGLDKRMVSMERRLQSSQMQMAVFNSDGSQGHANRAGNEEDSSRTSGGRVSRTSNEYSSRSDPWVMVHDGHSQVTVL